MSSDDARAAGGRWEIVFHEHYAGVVRRVTHLVGDRAAAEDIAQETFLRLMRHAPPRDGDLGPWLRVVATRLAYNHLRGERRRRARETAFERAGWTAGAGGDRGGSSATVRAALEDLPPRDRVILLLWAEGAPYAEIAAAIGVRPGSVGTILARAMRRLRRACDAREPAPHGPIGDTAPRRV